MSPNSMRPPSNHDDIFDSPRPKQKMSPIILLLLISGALLLLCVLLSCVVFAIALPSSSVGPARSHTDWRPLRIPETALSLNSDERSAVSWLRILITEQRSGGSGRFRTKEELMKSRDIKTAMSLTPFKNYSLEVTLSDKKDRFWLKMNPVKAKASTHHHFYAKSSGLIYYSKNNVLFNNKTFKPSRPLKLYRDKRQIDNENAVIGQLTTIFSAQALYKETSQNKRFASLSELKAANYVDEVLGSGTRQGYKYVVTPVGKDRYWVKASPVALGKVGSHYFFSTQEGTIYRATEDIEVDEATGKAKTKLEKVL